MPAVSLSEVKEHLNLRTGVNDAEVLDTLETAEQVIANLVGPLEPTTVTATVRAGWDGTLVVPVTPVLSLTSVTWLGTAQTVSNYTADPRSGVISAAWLLRGTYTVVYQAGYAAGALPRDLRMAVKQLTKHLFETQRGPTSRPGQDTPQTGPGYLLPFRVEQLLAPYQLPGVA